jgi:DNA-binding MarR family transcriptional regulator
MTESTGVTPGPVPARADATASVTESFIDLQRTVRRSKARLLAAAGDDVESAGQLLLHTVQADGPMRASALAASVQSDLSTVSRQVAALISRGLLERRADQLDGRASLLAVTEAGRARIAEHEQGRQAFFTEVLSGWTTAELSQFAQQLERFTASYDQIHTAWMLRRADRPKGSSSRAASRGRSVPDAEVKEGLSA